MPARHLSHLLSALGLRVEIIHTFDQLQTHPLTQAYVPIFQELRDGWHVVFSEELTIRDGLSAANARVVSLDMTLNSLASRVSKALLTVTEDDRTHPTYTHYFKNKSLSEFKKPILGEQHEAMAGWVTPLTKSGVPALMELAPEVEAAVKAADEAVKTRTALEKESSIFREVGNRKKFFDKVNAVRKQTYGELAKMPYEHAGLPSNFADMFFRHESSRDDDQTLEAMDKEIEALAAQLAAKQEAREALASQLAAQEEAKKAAQKSAQEEAIAELEKAAKDAAQKVADAKAKMAELSR